MVKSKESTILINFDNLVNVNKKVYYICLNRENNSLIPIITFEPIRVQGSQSRNQSSKIIIN